jgi:UDP-glucose 4-epimerase
MNVLITGGAGFIGSHVAEALERRGDDVLIVDDLSTGVKANLANVRGDLVVESVESRQNMGIYFKDFRPDVVVHAAASYKNPDAWERDAQVNVMGAVHVAKLSEEFGVKRIIFFQTSLCYGRPETSPIFLNHPLRPTSSYAITKTAAEQILLLGKTPVVSFRLANVYGPRNLSGPIPTFWKRIKEGKPCVVASTRRDFIFVEDMIPIVLDAVSGKVLGVFHISTGEDEPIQNVLFSVAHTMGTEPIFSRLPRGEDDVDTILLEPSFPEMRRTSLHLGIAQAVIWYEENGVGETFTHLRID